MPIREYKGRLLRSRRYTRTSPSSIRCVSSRSCRMSCSSPQHYGRAHQQVYGSVCLGDQSLAENE